MLAFGYVKSIQQASGCHEGQPFHQCVGQDMKEATLSSPDRVENNRRSLERILAFVCLAGRDQFLRRRRVERKPLALEVRAFVAFQPEPRQTVVNGLERFFRVIKTSIIVKTPFVIDKSIG